MIDIVKDKCTGCSACTSVCPRHCIQMKSNYEGFLYPVIDLSKCIHCNQCEEVCFVLQNSKKETPSTSKLNETWGATAKNTNLQISSSSGGVFSLLANYILLKKGVVYGVAFNEDFHKVITTQANSEDELFKLRNSKYMQSDVTGVFCEVLKQLSTGRNVIFSGTPCQIAGLKAFLRKDYDNLFCVDIICHGVPSVSLWDKYLTYLETKKQGKAVEVNFRKRRLKENNNEKIINSTRKCYFKLRTSDPYLQMYQKNICLRESCYHCTAKNGCSGSDITIGDFWGCDKVAPAMANEYGVSLVITHTEKGSNLFSKIENDLYCQEVCYQEAINYNPSYSGSVIRPQIRSRFYNDLASLAWGSFEKKYLRHSMVSNLKRMLFKIYKVLKKSKREKTRLEYGLYVCFNRGKKINENE